ncbi:MAG: sxtJ [Candidatus Marinimicrobia bacterium]|nr:sxtJ [Candidatus Neomarinimicrobiota bacterium]MBT3576376.1 sxtJ [Candidatus Neomarinimicrobiota bacterium]MBT3680074.1 sxtJ [Candidatus Neomarinimicrobiota bacterium]MBT3950059.1 sxtJ [Candidatus Neomarinimicrobiota bacterium]MBT4254358.1 sxtJ [Candidatus Neomarinimicrobiota bacterium]
MLSQELKLIWGGTDHGEFRRFGKTMGIFLLVIGLITYFLSLNYALPLISTGVSILLLGFLFPLILKPLYVLWMSFALILGFIMTRIILGLIFFLIFSPIGLVFRLIKKDHLDEAIDPDAASYWRIRDSKPYEPGMSEKQS